MRALRRIAFAPWATVAVGLAASGWIGCSSPGAAGSESGADASVATTSEAGPSFPEQDGGAPLDAENDEASASVADAMAFLPDAPQDGLGLRPDGAVLDAPDDSFDASTPDAPEGPGVDSSFDATPNVCGDGVRDPASEECDDGTNNADGTGPCSTTCEVQDFLASSSVSSIDAGPLAPYQCPPHRLGLGRHGVAGGPGGFAVAFLEQEGDGNFTLRSEAFDPGGVRVASFPVVGTPSAAMAGAEPAVAPVSPQAYAAVWADGSSSGVAMALLDTSSSAAGNAVLASGAGELASAPDAIWAGGQLVVAWEDDSSGSADLKVATFDSALNAVGVETVLTQTTADERDVTLAPFADSWAAAWRTQQNGLETIHVKAGDSEVIVTGAAAGPTGERPALVQIGPTTLFVAFSETVAQDDAGDVTTTILEGAVVETAAGGAANVVAQEISLAAQDDGGESRFPEGFPALAGVGGDVWLAAWTGGQPGDPFEDETWLASSPSGSLGGLGAPVVPLPRWQIDRGGVQQTPVLAVTGLGDAGAVVAAWEDDGWTLGGDEARPDVVLEVIPLPMLRRTP